MNDVRISFCSMDYISCLHFVFFKKFVMFLIKLFFIVFFFNFDVSLHWINYQIHGFGDRFLILILQAFRMDLFELRRHFLFLQVLEFQVPGSMLHAVLFFAPLVVVVDQSIHAWVSTGTLDKFIGVLEVFILGRFEPQLGGPFGMVFIFLFPLHPE